MICSWWVYFTEYKNGQLIPAVAIWEQFDNPVFLPGSATLALENLQHSQVILSSWTPLSTQQVENFQKFMARRGKTSEPVLRLVPEPEKPEEPKPSA